MVVYIKREVLNMPEEKQPAKEQEEKQDELKVSYIFFGLKGLEKYSFKEALLIFFLVFIALTGFFYLWANAGK
jgi:hypothetical protein